MEIHLQDGDQRIRPLESVVLQLRAFQTEEDEEGNEKRVRVLPQTVQFVLESESSGWLSRTFRNQVDSLYNPYLSIEESPEPGSK